MKILDVLYYYYYRYSVKILRESEPHATTGFMLSVSEAFLINGIINFITSTFFCYSFISFKSFPIAILVIILFLNYLFYQKTGRSRRIIKEKPVLWNSHRLSIIVTILFWAITFSWLFWVVPVTKLILENCK